VGVVCVEVYSLGAKPFAPIDSNLDVAMRVKEGLIPERPPLCLEAMFTGVLRHCFKLKPNQRPQFKNIVELLDRVTGPRNTDQDTDERGSTKPAFLSLTRSGSKGSRRSGGYNYEVLERAKSSLAAEDRGGGASADMVQSRLYSPMHGRSSDSEFGAVTLMSIAQLCPKKDSPLLDIAEPPRVESADSTSTTGSSGVAVGGPPGNMCGRNTESARGAVSVTVSKGSSGWGLTLSSSTNGRPGTYVTELSKGGAARSALASVGLAVVDGLRIVSRLRQQGLRRRSPQQQHREDRARCPARPPGLQTAPERIDCVGQVFPAEGTEKHHGGGRWHRRY